MPNTHSKFCFHSILIPWSGKNIVRTLFFLMILGFLAGSAVAAEIRGTVTSLSGKPIADALVLHRPSGAKTSTAGDGSFVLNIDVKGRLVLEVTHPDYADGLFSIPAKSIADPVRLKLNALIRQNEELVVTALRFPEPTAQIPAAASVISSASIGEGMPPNVTDALAGVPGVVPLGTGGFSLVPTIRGLARNRILIMIDNARITSDRRTGPNASFVSPEDIDRIEVLRSPSSIFYGSDALGGVVQIFTKSAQQEGIHGTVHAGYGTNNENAAYGLNLSAKKGPFSFYLSGQNDEAGNFSSPRGEVLQSGFHQASVFGRATYETDARWIDLSLLAARGTDIGKTANNAAVKPTWYPRENQNLIQFHWKEKNLGGGELNLLAYANPNFLETRTDTITGYVAGQNDGYVSKAAFAKTESTEFGAQISYSKKLAEDFRLTGGVDIFGRGGVDSLNEETSYNASGAVTKRFSETPFTKGKRNDLGFYVSGDYSGIHHLDLVAGLRYDTISQRANPGGGSEALSSKDSAVTGFVGLSYRLTDRLSAFANASRAYRTPGLSELFYSGITGRGVIIAQPNLKPETSVNGDVGLRYISNRFFVGAYAFLYGIDGLIDRFLVSDKVYTYGNLEDVQIKGVELELEYYPVSGWKVFGNLIAMKGESRATGLPINDVPPFRLNLGSRVWFGTLSFEASGIFQSDKDNPGPAEIGIPAYEYFQARVGYDFNRASVFVLVRNAFDKTFLGRPDPDSVYEPGRSFVLGLRYSF
jgi:outer membrane receptor protein involved in Fe transport